MDSSKEIDTLLNTYHFGTLQRMADEAGLRTRDERGRRLRKAQLITEMRANFFTRARVRASWEKLSERERAALNRLLLHGGRVPTKSFRRELIRAGLAKEAPKGKRPRRRFSYYSYSRIPYDRTASYIGDPSRAGSQIFEDLIARLTLHGLVFSAGSTLNTVGTSYKIQFHPAETIYVPQVIQQYLPKPEPAPPPLAGWEPERVEVSTPELLLRDLYLYWDFVRRNDVPLVRGDFVGKRSLKAINEILLVPDPLLEKARREDDTGRLYLLRQLLERLGLVHKEGGRLRPTIKDPLEVPKFWGQDQTEQLRACLRAWPKMEGFEELRDDAEGCSPRYAHARQAVRDALKKLPPNVWLEPEDLRVEVQVQDVDFLFADRHEIENRRGSWYYGHYYKGHYYHSVEELLDKLEELEGKFVNRCLTGFLHQVGVVELGYEKDTLRGFRLTPLGLALLDMEAPKRSSPQPQHTAGRLIIQPTFELVAMGPVSLATLARLDLFAHRQRADQAVFEYRLSRESVYEAQRKGLEVSELIRFLEQASDTGLPQNVRRSLEEWAAYHERIVFRTGVSLLQAADANLLKTLLDDPRIGRHLARPVSPEAALVKSGQQPQLVAALVKQGLFPAISDARPESADGSVIIREDGSIHPIHTVPSFYLRQRLSRLAEETDGGGWRLTPEAIRQAGGSRNRVLRLLEELGRLHRGPLPKGLVEWIKAQGGYYGHAAAETLTLIEFRDQATLEELREHPKLRVLLTPFPAGNRALAVVPANKLPQVQEILAHLGVHVKHGLQR